MLRTGTGILLTFVFYFGQLSGALLTIEHL